MFPRRPLLHLSLSKKSSSSEFKNPRDFQSKMRSPKSVTRIIISVALFAMGAALFYPASSASSLNKLLRGSPSSGNASSSISKAGADTVKSDKFAKAKAPSLNKATKDFLSLTPAAMTAMLPQPQQLFGSETIATYAADCVTPKNSFSLGETVCVKVTNAPTASIVLRRFSWSARSLSTVRSTNITNSTQTDTFTLPSTATSTIGSLTIDNRGTWKVSTIDTAESSVRTSAFFDVHDPATPTVDLQVFQSSDQTSNGVAPDTDADFFVTVANSGPDLGAGVSFTNSTPSGTTFVSATQTGGAPFNCTTASGATTCTAAAPLLKDASATFLFRYHVDAGAGTGTVISNQVNVTGTTEELDASNNSSVFNLPVTTQGTVVDNCSLTCPGDISSPANSIKIQLDQNGDPVLDQNGQPIPILDQNGNTIPGANVTFTVDAEGSACAPVTCTSASGSFFPVGSNPVTCTSAANDTCSFNVVVVGVNITLNGPSPMLITCLTQPFSDPGATATLIGGGSAQVTTTGTVPTDNNGKLVEGTYTITYSASDGTNTASVSRTVIVEASDLPTVTLNGPTSMTVECHTSFTDPGASASAACSGSLNVTTSGTVDINTPGTYTLTYTATDGTNTASAERSVRVVDTTAPTLALNGASPMTVECHTSFVDPGVTASDSCAGGAGVTVTTTGTVDANAVGTYTITYNGVDPSGNQSDPVTRTVNVVDTTAPTVTLVGGNMTVECHTSFTDPGASANDGCAGPVPVSTSGSVDVNTPGTYTLTYSANDGNGNTGTATRTVTVVDTTPPTISCPADIVVYLPLNSPATSMAVSYPAPTASDSCSSTVNVTSTPASGSVFPVGMTTVTSTATDASGNSSSCTFKVTVLYNFTGFFSPIGNVPTLNVVNAGRAIPIKFSLSGNKGLNIFVANSPASGVIACDANAPANELTNTVTAGDSSLSYDASTDQYIYVWKTDSSWAGTCRQLVLTLNDGSVHTANFKFK